MALALTSKHPRMLCGRTLCGIGIGAVICVVGYYAAEVGILCLSGTAFSVAAVAAVAAIPFNAMQGVASAVAFVLLSAALDRLQIKTRLQRIGM